MAKKAVLENDYERMVPEFHRNTLTYAEHITRYNSAEKSVADKVVLDIACGSGYGTQLLAKHAKKVYGVDVNETSVQYASENYGAPNIEYKTGDGEQIPLDDNSVDVVVTFETIEHIKDYKKFIKEVKRVLRPDGIAIVSTPNDLEFAEGNHFHLHEFEYDELVTLLKEDFDNIDSYYQATWKYVAVGSEEVMKNSSVVTTPTVSYAPLNPDQYLYFYLVCSNREIVEKIEPVAALGEHYSDRTILGLQGQANEQIAALNAEIDKINIARADAKEQLTKADQHIKHITSSRSYKVARKVSNARKKITHKR